jgi:hypothetical protein
MEASQTGKAYDGGVIYSLYYHVKDFEKHGPYMFSRPSKKCSLMNCQTVPSIHIFMMIEISRSNTVHVHAQEKEEEEKEATAYHPHQSL